VHGGEFSDPTPRILSMKTATNKPDFIKTSVMWKTLSTE
jgi:hypothetical protein